MAIDDAGPIEADPIRSGVIFGTGVGGLETLQEQIAVLDQQRGALGLAAARPDDDGERRRGRDLDALRLPRPVRDDRHRLRGRDPGDRQRRCG